MHQVVVTGDARGGFGRGRRRSPLQLSCTPGRWIARTMATRESVNSAGRSGPSGFKRTYQPLVLLGLRAAPAEQLRLLDKVLVP